MADSLRSAVFDLHAWMEEVYRATHSGIVGYLTYLGVTAAEAEELTQEVYIRLYKTMRKGQQIENLRAWLFRVAYHLGVKARARAALFPISELDCERLMRLSVESPENRLLEKERRMRIQAALQDLSAQQRNVLYLRVEGLRYREIAEVMGIASSTVGEFLARAIHRLSEALHG